LTAAVARGKCGPRLVKMSEQDTEVQWDNYARLEPGEYSAYCRSARWYRDPQFRRWTCLLRFDLLSADMMPPLATVPFWMNGGNREKPRAGRRSRYFAEWINAFGRPPTRTDRLTPRVFTRRMARVVIHDTKGPAPYSVVGKILSWDTGLSSESISQQVSQSRKARVKGFAARGLEGLDGKWRA
jgi:hypothetical protein